MEAFADKFAIIIRNLTHDSEDIVTLTLADPGGRMLRPFNPGAHIDLWLPDGVVRQYAISSPPNELNHYRIVVQLEPGGRASTFLRSDASIGQTIEVTGPRDTFGFVSARAYLFVADGIGLAPIMPMIHAIAETNVPWILHCSDNDLVGLPFRDELLAFGTNVRIHENANAFLESAVASIGDARPGTRLYCCATNPAMIAIEKAVGTWPVGLAKFERFAIRHPSAGPPRKPVRVYCARSNVTIDVPAHQSILTTLLAAGLDLPYSCREGTCATCAVRVLSGNPEHRDTILNDAQRAAGKIMMICVSRAQSEHLELDI